MWLKFSSDWRSVGEKWQQLVADLPCLPEQDEFIAKYNKVIGLSKDKMHLQPRLAVLAAGAAKTTTVATATTAI